MAQSFRWAKTIWGPKLNLFDHEQNSVCTHLHKIQIINRTKLCKPIEHPPARFDSRVSCRQNTSLLILCTCSLPVQHMTHNKLAMAVSKQQRKLYLYMLQEAGASAAV